MNKSGKSGAENSSVRATISFPEETYRTLEDIAKRKKVPSSPEGPRLSSRVVRDPSVNFRIKATDLKFGSKDLFPSVPLAGAMSLLKSPSRAFPTLPCLGAMEDGY